MSETAMERIIRARESQTVEQLSEQIEPLAQSLAVLGQDAIEAMESLVLEAESQHETLNDSIRASQEALSLTVSEAASAANRITSAANRITWQMMGIAVGVGLLVGIAAGTGSWVLLKDHWVKSRAMDVWKPEDAQIVIDGLLK